MKLQSLLRCIKPTILFKQSTLLVSLFVRIYGIRLILKSLNTTLKSDMLLTWMEKQKML